MNRQNERDRLYEHLDIDTKERQIRILSILPGQGLASGQFIECTLRRASLDENPQYIALSYRWGHPTDPKSTVLINGIKCSIFQNLEIALRHLQKPSERVDLWTDALCIDQENNDEKKAQIEDLMDHIYFHAPKTVIFLGARSHDSDLAMDTIRDIHREPPQQFSLLSLDNDKLHAIKNLFRTREWWNRVWVIQEALLSQNPVVQCGMRVVPLEYFCVLYNFIISASKLPGYVDSPLREANLGSTLLSILPSRGEASQNRRKHSLCGLLGLTRAGQATCKKDKIFGLLGLVRSSDREAIKEIGGYRANDQDILKHITVDMLRCEEQGVSILALSFLELEPSGDTYTSYQPPLPSWTPDWMSNLDCDKTFIGLQPFPVCGNKNGSLVSISKNEQILTLSGYVLDKVKIAVQSPVNTFAAARAAKFRMSPEVRRTVQSWLEDILDANDEGPYKCHLSKIDAFARTIICNNIVHLDREPDSSFGARVEAALDVGDMFGAELLDLSSDRLALPFDNSAITRLANHTFIVTERGYFGLAPWNAKTGDDICFLPDNYLPFLFRKKTPAIGQCHDNHFQFIGPVYAHLLIGDVVKVRWVPMKSPDGTVDYVALIPGDVGIKRQEICLE